MNSTQPTTQNLFPWLNPSAIDFSYRRIPVELPCLPGREEDYHRQLQKVVRYVSSAIKGPAALLRSPDGKTYVAIPADRSVADLLVKTRPRPLQLSSLDTVETLRFAGCSDQERALILQFVEFDVRHQIKSRWQLVEDGAGRFFFKNPVKATEQLSVWMLPGFSFRLVADGPDLVHFCLDITYRYLDSKRLSQLINPGNAHFIKRRLFKGRGRKGLPCLYQMGDRWFPIRVVGFGGRVGDETITDTATGKVWSLIDYLKAKTQGDKFKVASYLSPDDVVVYFVYPNKEMEPLSAPAGLVRQLFKTGDSQVKSLHNKTIVESTERFNYIGHNIKRFFANLSFNQVALQISEKPLEEMLPVLEMKALKFNFSRYLTPAITPETGNTPLFEYGKRRRSLLESVGILDQSRFDAQYLIVPDTMTMAPALRDVFQKQLEKQLKALASTFPGFTKVIPYRADTSIPATDLVDKVSAVLEKFGAQQGYALLVLPDWNKGDDRAAAFHDIMMKRHYPKLKFQCANFGAIDDYFSYKLDEIDGLIYHHPDDKQARLFKSYAFYLALEYLKLNRKFPYALKDPLHYDIYIGIDVHDRYAGFLFFYRNGERIVFDYLDVPKKPSQQRAEKLSAEQIVKGLYPNLKKHLGERRYCLNPNGIVLLRDGRSHGGEGVALQQVIAQLQADGLLGHPDFTWGIVDVHKTSQLPFRSATPGRRPLERPTAGTYRLLGHQHRDAYLFPTGEPFQTRGSSKPLQLSLIEGTLEFTKVIEDVFAQSLLAFSAPDRPSALPIVIKLLDAFLAPLAVSESLWQEEPGEEEDDIDDNAQEWDEMFMQQLEQMP